MISQKVREDEEKEIIRFLCYKYQKFNLVALLKYMGHKRFLQFLDIFSGCYVKIPPAARLINLINQYRLYKLGIHARRLYREKKILDWQTTEMQFLEQCKKLKIQKERGKQFIREMENILQAAYEWETKLNALEKEQC